LNTIAKFMNDESGATAIEYGLIAALVFLVALSAMQLLGAKVDTMFKKVTAAVSTAAP